MDTLKRLTVPKQVEIVDNAATGNEMRVRRKLAGLSLREIGERLHISAAFLSDLELGRRPWTEERARQYVQAISGA